MEQKTRIRGQENGRSLFCVGVWEELLEEVVFKHQPQGVRELPCSYLGEEHYKLEGSEARACSPCLKNNKEVSVARAESTRGPGGGEGGTDYDGPSRP